MCNYIKLRKCQYYCTYTRKDLYHVIYQNNESRSHNNNEKQTNHPLKMNSLQSNAYNRYKKIYLAKCLSTI